MVLQIDSSAPLRTSAELAVLVEAVLGAAAEDESRAIEWKGAFADLREQHSSFTVARAVLGMANRPVALARQDYGGLGYVVVGATPGSLEHQPQPDSAELLAAIGRYTGHGWPYFDPRVIRIEGKDVLVVVVQRPQDGDRIALLQRSYQPPKGPQVEEGTIFVRRPGATQRASRQELESLQDRLLAGIEATAAAGRRDERRREARELVAQLVHAGTQWTSAQRVLVLASPEAKNDRSSSSSGPTPTRAARWPRTARRWSKP